MDRKNVFFAPFLIFAQKLLVKLAISIHKNKHLRFENVFIASFETNFRAIGF
jgi:hypothetical protein